MAKFLPFNWRSSRHSTGEVCENKQTVRLPIHAWEKLNKVKAARHQFFKEHNRYPTIKEIAELLEMSEDKLSELLELHQQSNCTSLDMKIGTEQDTQLIDLIASNQPGTFDAIASNDIRDALEGLISNLSEKEALVLRMRFGLDDGESKTLQAIGETLGVSRERIRQVQTKALRKLRASEEVRSFRGVA